MEFGPEVAAETARHLAPNGVQGERGLSEAAAVATFLVTCARFAYDIYSKRHDRALLLSSLVEDGPQPPTLDPEIRLKIIGKVVNLLAPDVPAASPSLSPDVVRAKKDWMRGWLTSGSREASPTVLMPFADMDNFIVYESIRWSPPSGLDLPNVVVPRGFVTDLATVPSYFWWAVPPAGRYGHAAILHDWLYWDQSAARGMREVADRVFDVAMSEMKVGLALRKAMWAAVRVYGGPYWNTAGEEKLAGQSRILKRFPDQAGKTWEEWRRAKDVFV